MPRNHFFWLFLIATTIVFSNTSRADNHVKPDEQRLNNYIMQRLDYLLEQVGQSLGQRYNLDQTTIDKLKRSIVESIEIQLKQEKTGNVRSFAGAARKGGMEMLEIVLSQPGCRAALAKHLNDKQLQDYLDFTRARGQRDQQAINRHLTAVWDHQLSLTANQRRQIEQLLSAKTGTQWRLTSMDVLYDSEESVNMAYHKLKASMDEVLSESQSNIWRLLATPAESKNRRKVKNDEDEIREKRFDEAEEQIIEAVRVGKITRQEAGEKIEAMKEEIWARDKDDNKLDDEDWDEDEDPRKEEFQRAEKRIRIAIEAGRITKQQAEERLAEMKLRADGAANGKMKFDIETQKDQESGFKDVLTNHPLYQKTINDVLSIEAYAEYQRKQEKKKAYYMMASRDLVVAMLDTTLLLSEKQRQQIETVVEDLPSSYDFGPDTNRQLFARLMTEKNSVNLSQWQQDRVGEYTKE